MDVTTDEATPALGEMLPLLHHCVLSVGIAVGKGNPVPNLINPKLSVIGQNLPAACAPGFPAQLILYALQVVSPIGVCRTFNLVIKPAFVIAPQPNIRGEFAQE